MGLDSKLVVGKLLFLRLCCDCGSSIRIGCWPILIFGFILCVIMFKSAS